jgi:hypothetical protein
MVMGLVDRMGWIGEPIYNMLVPMDRRRVF